MISSNDCPTCGCPRPPDPFHGWWKIRIIRNGEVRIALEFPQECRIKFVEMSHMARIDELNSILSILDRMSI